MEQGGHRQKAGDHLASWPQQARSRDRTKSAAVVGAEPRSNTSPSLDRPRKGGMVP